MTILEQYDRAWRHFDMIAQQRIASFNHYLIVLGVLLTASAAVKLGPMHAVVLGLIGAASMAAPVLFWCLDRRICRLLDNLKDTLRALEATDGWPEVFKPFHRDQREQQSLFNKATTYTGVFWSLFLIHFGLGFFLLVYAIGCPKASNPEPELLAPPAVQQQKAPTQPTSEGAQSLNGIHFHYHKHSTPLPQE